MPAVMDVAQRGRDQARALRGFARRSHLPTPPERTWCRTVAVTSGKGGVGKSQIALNLAVAMAHAGRRVCLVDGNLGLGGLDLLCGLNGYWNLSHVVTGARSLHDIVLTGPAGIHLVPGGSGVLNLADCPRHVQEELLVQLQCLEADHDVLLIDTGSGIHQLVRQFALAADDVLVVTTPEPTAMADAYATIKVLSAAGAADIHIVVNQCDDAGQAEQVLLRLQETTRLFLRLRLGFGGWVPRDAAVTQAVWERRPFQATNALCPAARAVKQLAERLVNPQRHSIQKGSFFSRLWPRLDTVE